MEPDGASATAMPNIFLSILRKLHLAVKAHACERMRLLGGFTNNTRPRLLMNKAPRLPMIAFKAFGQFGVGHISPSENGAS